MKKDQIKIISCNKLAEKENISHAFFTRNGGVSSGLYSSLNLGAGSHDLQENIEKNRAISMDYLGFKQNNLHTLYQVHSDKVIAVTGKFEKREEADAMVTNEPNVVLGILTADCTPVLFADSGNKVIGAAHAGWKGALSGILQNTIKQMEGLGADKDNIEVAIGPTISQKSYEVGKEFYDRFIIKKPENAVFFISSIKPQHFMFDLAAYITYQLKNIGIKNISNVGLDTYANENDFFSYRRSCHKQENDYGRNLSVIALK